MDRKALVIAGVHRSGTSAFTRVLNLMGADLPWKLQPPAHDNPRGFWESMEVIAIGEEILESAGSFWHDVTAFPRSWFDSPAAAVFRHRTLAILQRDLAHSTLFVIKDPRICRMIPFWVSVLQEFEAQPNFVLTVRNPLEVAASLRARNGFSREKSLLLWLRHVLDAELDTRGFPRSFVSYSRLLDDWKACAGRLAADLGISWPRESALAEHQVECFLSREDRHHDFSPADLRIPGVAKWVELVYSALLNAAETGEGERLSEIPRIFDDVRNGLEQADLVFGPLLAFQKAETDRQGHEIDQLKFELSVVQAVCEETDRTISRLEQELTLERRRGDNLAADVEQLRGELNEEKYQVARLRRSTGLLPASNKFVLPGNGGIVTLGAALRLAVSSVSSAATRRLRRIKRIPATVRVFANWNRLRDARVIWNSGLFDPDYYRETYPDIAAVGWGPLEHFIRYGAFAGRKASATFDTAYYLKENPDVAQTGINPLIHYIKFGMLENRLPAPPSKASLPKGSEDLEYTPLTSIVMPVYNTDAKWLIKAVQSVQKQTYANWELCICDDGSTNPDTLAALGQLSNVDERVKVTRMDRNSGISRATNAAIALAAGDYVALMDHDDELTPDALLYVVKELNLRPHLDVLYSDQDKIDSRGVLTEPFFKPDWSPEYFRGVMYVGHLLVVRRSLINDINGLDPEYDGVQDYELMLRLSEATEKITHIPKILYHWRKIPGSVAMGFDEKSPVADIPGLQIAAVNAHLQRCRVPGMARKHKTHPHRVIVDPEPRNTWPLVSIIIPVKNMPEYIGPCLESVFSLTTYKNFEVVVVDNGSSDQRTFDIYNKYGIQVVPFNEKFNHSRANNLGVANARGEYLILLNGDTEVITGDWIETLLFYVERSDVGVAGPLLLYPNETVQHAGVVLGFRGTADHIMRGFPGDSDGYFGSLSCSREVSAVTAACLMVSRETYMQVGGLNEYYATIYNDVDFCLRVRESGMRIIYTPRAALIHHESVARGSDYDFVDRAVLLDAWGATINRGDPYYSPMFSLTQWDYTPHQEPTAK